MQITSKMLLHTQPDNSTKRLIWTLLQDRQKGKKQGMPNETAFVGTPLSSWFY